MSQVGYQKVCHGLGRHHEKSLQIVQDCSWEGFSISATLTGVCNFRYTATRSLTGQHCTAQRCQTLHVLVAVLDFKQQEICPSARMTSHLCYQLPGLLKAHYGLDVTSGCIALVITKLSMIHACTVDSLSVSSPLSCLSISVAYCAAMQGCSNTCFMLARERLLAKTCGLLVRLVFQAHKFPSALEKAEGLCQGHVCLILSWQMR